MVEIQIRTRAQDRWAQVSERLAVQFGTEIKYGGGPPWVKDALTGYSETVLLVERLEQQHHDMEHVAQDLRERTSDTATLVEHEKLVAGVIDLEKRVRQQREILERELESIAALIEKGVRNRGSDDLPN